MPAGARRGGEGREEDEDDVPGLTRGLQGWECWKPAGPRPTG